MAGKTARETTQSRQSSPDELLNGSNVSLFEFGQVPRIQLVKPSFSLSDDTLFDLGILHGNQQLQQSAMPANLQYVGPQQYMLPQGKDDTLEELEDYVQGLNDRFDLPGDQLMTPRCSFEQDSPLRTDATLVSTLSPPSNSKGILPSPATSDLQTTPPHVQVQDIYSHHGITSAHTTPLKQMAIPPPFVQKTPLGAIPYNPQMPVFVTQGMYPTLHTTSPPHHHHQHQHQPHGHVRTASMADISSPIVAPRFPTPPLSQTGEILKSPTFPPYMRSGSPHDVNSSPHRHTSPESDSTGNASQYGSPQRRTNPSFETPPFSPQFAPPMFGSHLQEARRRGHTRGYSTTSIMSTATFATDASSPLSSSEEDHGNGCGGPYVHDGPVKGRGVRQSNIPDDMMASYIAGPDPRDHKFECLFPDCGKRFGRKYNIQSHIQTHLSDRPYRCETCRAGFVRQHDLRRHEKIHGGDKPFVCACRKSFARQDALTRHRQRYHPKNYFRLLTCVEGFVLGHSRAPRYNGQSRIASSVTNAETVSPLEHT